MKRICQFLIIALCLAMPLSGAMAKTAHGKKHVATAVPVMPPIVAKYDVYVGGVHLITSDILFQEQPPKYHARVTAQTYGFWNRMTPWNTVLESNGRITKDGFAPAEFYTRDEWNHKPKVTKLHFDKKGNVTPEFDPPSHDENRENDTTEQRRGSYDPVTALQHIMAHVAIAKDCNISVPVFDGKRLFTITGVDKGPDDIDEEDYGIFKGTARLCDADFTMVAGDWKDREHSNFWKKNEKEAGREPFHVWLAPVGPDSGGGKAELPVRLESGSVFGLIVGHLSGWRFATSDEIKP
jgi:hypothetical protein